jgi:hypothetical protein
MGKGGRPIGATCEHHHIISAAGKPVSIQQADGAGCIGNKGFGMGSRHDIWSFRDRCSSFPFVRDLPDLRGCLSHLCSIGQRGPCVTFGAINSQIVKTVIASFNDVQIGRTDIFKSSRRGT